MTKKYLSKNFQRLPDIDTLFIPDDYFQISKNLGDSSREWFLKNTDNKDVFLKYEYYIKSIKNRGRNYLKNWLRNGYPLIDLLNTNIFHDYGCINKKGMEKLLKESHLGLHYL
jgi:hypothetical protein